MDKIFAGISIFLGIAYIASLFLADHPDSAAFAGCAAFYALYRIEKISNA